MACGGSFFAGRGGRAELNQDYGSHGSGDRSDGVEDDAERAVVGVRLERMDVRDLNDGEEGQQDEAQDRGRNDHAWPGEEGLASSWLEPTQFALPRLRIQ